MNLNLLNSAKKIDIVSRPVREEGLLSIYTVSFLSDHSINNNSPGSVHIVFIYYYYYKAKQKPANVPVKR